MGYYVYMLACRRDGKMKMFYTGQTNDLDRRVREHKRNAANGKRRKFTGRFDEVELVWFEEVETLKEAKDEEQRIKKLSPGQKRQLILGSWGK
jgi:predicted GIY-YIG superfamily endonuclease